MRNEHYIKNTYIHDIGINILWFKSGVVLVISTRLKLWVAVARHNFKRVKVQFYILARLKGYWSVTIVVASIFYVAIKRTQYIT